MDLSGNICMRPEESDRFQAIYGTQLYSSFFGMYARFACKNNGKSSIKVDQIDFIGITYKGPINIEIADVRLVSNKEGIQLALDLRGGICSPPITNIFSLDLKEHKVTVKDRETFYIERELLPLYKGSSSNVIDRAFVSGHFDSEFYERDGLFVKKKTPTNFSPGDYIGNNLSAIQSSDGTKNLGKMNWPGPKCTPAYSVIIV